MGLIAVPWHLRNKTNATGTLFKQYYLIRAGNIKSAFKKADYLLSISEHREGDGKLNGKRVAVRAVGILDIEPVLEPIQSGVEIFDESESKVSYSLAKSLTIGERDRIRMIAYEAKHGKPTLLAPIVGAKFNRL